VASLIHLPPSSEIASQSLIEGSLYKERKKGGKKGEGKEKKERKNLRITLLLVAGPSRAQPKGRRKGEKKRKKRKKGEGKKGQSEYTPSCRLH